jgi:outer membrane protein OmpA-like peptidoglycan-associated protein
MSSPRKGISKGQFFSSKINEGIFFDALNMKALLHLTAIIAILHAPYMASAMEIRQEEFRYTMNLAQDIACNTFVITDQPNPSRLATVGCQTPVIHFPLGSAVLASAEAETLMAGLRACRMTKNTPLLVTGHACSLGSENFNQDLSLKRARSVAGLLQDCGYTVAEVTGKGSLAPMTTDPQQLYLNRRVEITPVAHQDAVSPVFQGR